MKCPLHNVFLVQRYPILWEAGQGKNTEAFVGRVIEREATVMSLI